MKQPRLFVYGTLLPGGRAPPHLRTLLETRAHRIGRGSVPGRLHDAGAFPAAVKLPGGEGDAASRIRGLVYALEAPDEVLPVLDDHEGVRPDGTGLFSREVAEVRLDSGDTVEAWIYWYGRDTGRLPEIRGGDWSDVQDRSTGGTEG